MSDYPAPRYLRLRRPKTVEEMMPKARELVNQPPGQFFFALKPSYDIKAGDKILFVVLREYDPMVIEAVCRAMRELGARIDVLTLDVGQVAPQSSATRSSRGSHQQIPLLASSDHKPRSVIGF